jgi:hypothetical protein
MFTYRDYYDLLTTITDSCQLYLRHDVDVSLKKAVELAEREYKMSIGPACYFLLPTSKYYNPYAEDSRRIIEQMLDMGHKIGLHYDLSILPDDDETRSEKVALDAMYLGEVFNTEITAISAHKPMLGKAPSYTMLTALQVIGLNDPSITLKGYKYISDSGMNFRDDPIESLKYHNKIHLNTHPEWWANDEGTYEDRLHALNVDLEYDQKINNHVNEIKEYRKVVMKDATQ